MNNYKVRAAADRLIDVLERSWWFHPKKLRKQASAEDPGNRPGRLDTPAAEAAGDIRAESTEMMAES